jgi:hypothetical protein
MMRRFMFIIDACIALCLPWPLGAQQPDWDLARKAWDSPISYGGGWYMPRYAWHTLGVAEGVSAAWTISTTTGMKWQSSLVVSCIGTGIVPHAVGLAARKYPLNTRDVAFDAFLRCSPIILVSGFKAKAWQSRVFALTTVVATYFALAPFASP